MDDTEERESDAQPWFQNLDCEPFAPDLSDESEVLDCRLSGDMTVQGCEGTLRWSVLAQPSARETSAAVIAQAEEGMRQVARSCLDGATQQPDWLGQVWMNYAAGFFLRNQEDQKLFRQYPFLWAIVFSAHFREVRDLIVVRLNDYQSQFSKQGGMCDIRNPSGAGYAFDVENRRRAMAAQTNRELQTRACWNSWYDQTRQVVSPQQLIEVLIRMSRECPIDGMKRFAARRLERFAEGKFLS